MTKIKGGNLYDKHNSRNPLVKGVMRVFHARLIELAQSAKTRKVLDVGCGEGYTTEILRRTTKTKDLFGIDLDENVIKLAKSLHPSISFKHGSIYAIPYEKNSFDLITCTEVLEHLDNPTKAIKELKRVSKKHVLISVPNEPLWRIGNMARLKYVKNLGNTPGHINHWSKSSLKKLLLNHFSKVHLKSTLLWNLALCEK